MRRRLLLLLGVVVVLVFLASGLVVGRRWAARRAAPPPPVVEPRPQVPRVPPRPLAQGRPNVVLVVGCTLRRDQLTPYGAPREVSPFLHTLALDGTRFLHGVDAAPWTRAASTALVTGRHPIEVGMVEPAEGANRRALAPQVVTLAERLHDAGYETIGLTANPNLNRAFGFDQGFDAYHEAQEQWREGDTVKTSGSELVDQALRLVDGRARSDAPLYLRLVTLDTHQPIDVPRREARAVASDGVPPQVAAYRVEVQRWDSALQQLWRGLRRRGYTEHNTVLVVVNDHGEGLQWPPEHGLGHGNFLLPSAIDMPWIVYGHRVARGHLVAGVASQIDVHPTLLGLAGVTGYEGPGRDFSAQVRGESDRTDRDRAYVDTWFTLANRAAIYTPERLCVHDFEDHPEELGLSRMLPKTACFDRRVDPMVRLPLPAVDQALIDDLMAWREARLEDLAAWPHTAYVDGDDGALKQLEALGYVEP